MLFAGWGVTLVGIVKKCDRGKYSIFKDQNPCLVIIQVINNNISFIEIKKIIKNYLAYIANDYPKYKSLFLPDLSCRMLHAGFYCIWNQITQIPIICHR